MAKWIKNTDTVDHTWLGQVIVAGAYYEIQAIEETSWINDSSLLTAIGAGEATVAKDDSGTKDLIDVNDGINYLKGLIDIPKDTDGVALSRTKITRSGWHYQAHWVDFKTATHKSAYNCDDFGNDLGFVKMRFFKGDQTELIQDTENSETDAAFQIRLDTDCEVTILDWEPSHNMDIIGASLHQAVMPTSDVRLWVIGVPFLTPAQGGSVVFGQGGINLRYMGVGNVLDIDGKTAKTMYTDPNYHTNEFRIKSRHSLGTKHSIGVMYKIYIA